MKKKISLLGSSGSIGRQTIDVVSQHDDLEIVSMCCKSNIDIFEKQIRTVRPKKACIFDKGRYIELKRRVSDVDVEILCGMDGINEIVSSDDVDMVVGAISGMIGLEPTLTAIKAKKDIALANKETLVTAGDIVMNLARENNVTIYPVDSEHSAIYQCLKGRNKYEIEKIILTASGGPFRGYSKEDLNNVTKEQALKHPNWDMGAKITIDSSTLVNKGLEVIEASKLFDQRLDNIEVIIHPQSIIHSMVQFKDGAILAQMGTSSMKIPIQYALYRGERKLLDVERVDFIKFGNLTFDKPNLEIFRGLSLCMDALKIGGTMPAVLNAANEIAVHWFLKDKIMYRDIVPIIERTMSKHSVIENPTLEDIYCTINWVREVLYDN